MKEQFQHNRTIENSLEADMRVRPHFASGTEVRGALIAVGGAMRVEGPILAEFYRLSGGEDGRILILPTASELPDSGFEIAEALSRLGLRSPARVLPLHSREDARRADFCAAVEGATGLFMTGGVQSRLTSALCGTPFFDAMQAMYRRGGTVAGTSAGTAALSELMIAFGRSGTLPYPNIARFSTGLGFIDSCVFDQHFRQRNRIGRLLYAIACHPNLLGIGIDEDTAAVIQGNLLSVAGSGAVTVVDGARLERGDSGAARPVQPMEMSGVQLHIITQGGCYNLQEREVMLTSS